MFTTIKKYIYSMINRSPKIELKYESIKISVVYLVIGFLWIYFSDKIVSNLTTNRGLILIISTYKGWLYVIVTSIILYLLIRALLKKVDLAEKELHQSNQELSQAYDEIQASLEQLAAAEEELRTQYEQIIENEIKLIESEQKNKAIVQAMPDLLFLIDKEGYFTDCIASDETLLLLPKENFIGKKIGDILSGDIVEIAYEKMQSVFTYGKIEWFEYKLLISEEEQYFEIRMMKNNEREILAISRNITSERKREIELKLSERKYKTLVKRLQLGLALYEGNTGQDVKNYMLIEVNDSHERLTGLKNKDIRGKNLGEIFPTMETGNIEKLEHTIRSGEPIYYERYQERTGIYYEIMAYRPKKLQLAIIINDITQRRQAEEATRVSECNFRNIFENSSDAILMVSENKVIDCNSATTKLLGYESKESIIGKVPSDFSPEKQPNGEFSNEKALEAYTKAQREGKYKFEWWHQRNDGSLIPVEIMMTIILYDGKKVYHCLCRDIRDRKQMEENLKYLSIHDQLTGLYNRRFFEEEITRLDVDQNLPFTITMADINGLKLVNDSFGHATGDELLRKVAQVLKQGCREKDILFRLSGDEFVIMSPNTDNHEAEEIIRNINAIALNEKVGLVNISISFGFDVKRSKDEPIFEIIKKAEDYMYRKKLYDSPSMRGKTIHAIITTLHEKNKREEQHSRRVSELCCSMGNALGLSEDKIKELKTVGLLHDIGKIAIEESLLNKKEKLTKEEWEEVKRHPEIGYRILSTVNDLSEMAEYVLAHHERWDGRGYPKGLKGEDIPLQSRIISIVDAYDAMVSERSYRNSLTKEAAIQELKINAGTQFNPELVKVFIDQILNETSEI